MCGNWFRMFILFYHVTHISMQGNNSQNQELAALTALLFTFVSVLKIILSCGMQWSTRCSTWPSREPSGTKVRPPAQVSNVQYRHMYGFWTLTWFSPFWLRSPPQWTWNEPLKVCFKCRLSTLIWGYLHPNRVNSVGITTYFICGFPFGQLDRCVCCSLVISFKRSR